MSLFRNKYEKILYASSAIDEQDFSKLFSTSINKPGQQAQKFNRMMMSGFYDNGMKVIAISTPPITKKNYKKIFLKLKSKKIDGINFQYIATINVPIIKNIINIIIVFCKVIKFGKDKNAIIVCDVLNASVAYGSSIAGKILNLPIVGIVTDIPELMVTGHTARQVRMINHILSNCTHFVFLTDAMNNRINFLNKPYVVIEGICDVQCEKSEKITNSNCIYAGLLDELYGVKKLVNAFILANVPNHELHIYGDGPYADELKKISEKNDNIIYHGVVMNDEVMEAEKKAKLLINPRPSNEEFTKFSFPSKNLEYMSTGTAVLSTKLPGMPGEYFEYIYTFDDESVEGMSNRIKNLLSITEDELIKKGLSAQMYVKKNKNKSIQTNKILNMLRKSNISI